MTIGQIRDQLPRVRVKLLSGEVAEGVLVGRRCRFATVAVRGVVVGEWSWEAVASAINNGRPLRV